MIASAATLSPHARLAHARLAGSRVLAASGAAALVKNRQQHTREFHFGWWMDRGDREQHREIRRRYKAMRHKYSDALSRKLWWEQQAAGAGEIPRHARRAVNHYWQPRRCFAFTRYRADKGAFGKSTMDEATAGTRPSQNVEDAERNAWSPFVFRDGEVKGESWASPFDDIRSYIAKRQSELLKEVAAGFGVPHKSSAASTSALASASVSASSSSPVQPAQAESDYVIDPITNRKVSKACAKSSPDESVDIPAMNFKTYRSKFTAPTDLEISTVEQDIIASFDGPPAPPVPSDLAADADLPPTMAELNAYKRVMIDDIDDIVNGRTPSNADSQTGEQVKYEDLHKYKPVEYNEPDGKLPDIEPAYSPEELEKYQPIKWNEPDGRSTEPPVEIGHEGYDPAEVQQYKPFKWNEPDGKPATAAPPTEHPYDPEELAKYKPFHWNEPDGQPTTPPVEIGHAGYDPAEVQKYKPFMWNEPHGKSDEPVELGHEGYDPAEVQKYKPFEYHEPHGQPPNPDEELGFHGYDPAEVQRYQAFRHNEPDGKPAVSTEELGHEGYDPAEVQRYQAFRYNEPDGKPPVFDGELGHEGYDPAEVQQYQAFRHNEPDGKPLVSTEELGHHGYDPAEVQQYGAFRYQEPDGKPEVVADSSEDGLKEFDTKAANAETPGEVYSKVLKRLNTLTHLDGEGASQDGGSALGSFGAGTRLASSTKAQSASQDRTKLESSMARINSEHDAIDKLASVSVKSFKSRARKQMSDAERAQAHLDPYSKEPQGLETAFSEECRGGEASWPAYVKIHRRVESPEAADEDVAAMTASSAGPFVYKILAYDPTMQTINVGETTSTVPDAACPLTPAEALLRLSNPTKFFPHFQPLQSQGFEIVSGSGDVLVFRKACEAAESSSSESAQDALPSTVNPIDMTGKPYVAPSTANFASPTGYVNLDLPQLTADLPSDSGSAASATMRVPTNIGVRRQEPVFSGPKDNASGAAGDTKPGVARRMVVGATWVAGVSYVLGVASEFIKGR